MPSYDAFRSDPAGNLGIAGYREGDTVDDVIRHADLAMYAAKNGGRNRVVDYDHLDKSETP